MQIRTDLAMESQALSPSPSGVTSRRTTRGNLEEIDVKVESDEAAKALEKDKGAYITLYHPLLSHADAEERKEIIESLARVVRELTPKGGDILVVGLGNRHMTADSLGSRVVEDLLITRHMKDMTEGELKNRLRGVCGVAPGVLGVTGMETAEMIKGITEHVHPAAVIAIDALAARESSRIGTTIQVTDTGIRPGSGVGNHRAGLNRDSLGVPVIAVGVPMVVYAAVIARDALSLLLRDMDVNEDEHQQAMDGMVEQITRQGLGELVVTPREVDELVGRVARLIADGLNLALQPDLSLEEIQYLSHDGP